jgi:hypothetical protein
MRRRTFAKWDMWFGTAARVAGGQSWWNAILGQPIKNETGLVAPPPMIDLNRDTEVLETLIGRVAATSQGYSGIGDEPDKVSQLAAPPKKFSFRPG